MSTIFTKIINREIEANIIHETENVIAFLDVHPIRPGHILVVPKQEIDEIQNLDQELYREVMDVVYQMARLIKERLGPPRVGILVQGFDVPHAHVHVTPLQDSRDVVSTTRGPNFMDEEPDFEALADMRKRLIDDDEA